MLNRQLPRLQHAFTIDVEDWYHGSTDVTVRAFGERRLYYSLGKLLDLLAEYDTRATFFWLGQAAVENPDLVKQVAAGGHEIGCHGWVHDPIYTMEPNRFRVETRQATDCIANLVGQPVVTYRAPYFSITRKSWWALEILTELGFRYDSSIFPIQHWRYGIPEFSPQPHWIQTQSGVIYELPMSTRKVFGQRIPVSGGSYFRCYPYLLTKSNFEALEQENRAAIFYTHPWELDLGHPSVPLTWRERITHQMNRSSTELKLRQLLQDFRFSTLRQLADQTLSTNTPTADC